MNRMLNRKYFSFVLAAGLFTGVGLFATPSPGPGRPFTAGG